METVKTGKEKQLTYTTEYKQFNKAMKEEFYLEALVIGYAIIEDRLVAFLHHAGIVTRTNQKLEINKSVYPYIRRLLKKDDDFFLKIKDISVKIDLIKALIEMTEEDAIQIDNDVSQYVSGLKRKKSVARKGFMIDLFNEMKKIDKNSVLKTLEKVKPWRENRNQLIHALLNKTVESAQEAKKDCAEESYLITREIDNDLVKPFKKANKLRKKYNIQ